MTTATGKTRCTICDKEKATIRCGGCSDDFCYKHWESHREELNKQLDEIGINRDLFRQLLTQQIEQPNNHVLIQQINQWERDSIKKITKAAEEARQIFIKSSNQYTPQLEAKLNELTNQLRQSRQEDDFNEINLRQFQEELNRLNEQLTKPLNISIREDSTPFISQIYIEKSGEIFRCIHDTSAQLSHFSTQASTHHINIAANARWTLNGITIAGGVGRGDALNQLALPHALCVDEDQTIYIADYLNNRIVEWKHGMKSGQVVAGGNGVGNRTDQLNHPTDVIIDKKTDSLIISDWRNRRVMRCPRRGQTSGQTIVSNVECRGLAIDDNGFLYVTDREKNEVRRWRMGETCGTVVAGGNGEGDHSNQLSFPIYVFVDREHSVFVSERDNNRVTKWVPGAKEGIIVAGGHGRGNALTQLSYPQGVVVDHLGTVFVADEYNHRIMRWPKGATKGSVVVGGNGQGNRSDQLNGPIGLSFDRRGNLYVADLNNARVQRFDIEVPPS